ncbi:MAG: hypothetical protein ACOVRN_16945 [Flavobacterium sp.]
MDYLDDNWIRAFEETDKIYEDFYKDDLYYVNIRVIYVNRDNEIAKVKHETLLLTKPNVVSREDVVGILKKNTIDNARKYDILSILRYNINLEPDEVQGYLAEDDKLTFLSVIKHIDEITFDKSISMFHDLNDLVFVFYESNKEVSVKRAVTKRVYLDTLLGAGHRKTIKKRYKDILL